jgi:uncharacterized protein (DUF362 family)
MERRSFLKLAGVSIMMGAGLARPLWGKDPSVVAVAEGADYGGITRGAVGALGGMKKFVRPGDTVVVKPNIGWDRRPEFGANTHPVVVKTIVEECLAAGAKRVKVFDIPCNDPRRCYENSGIQGILKGMKNVEMKHPEPDRFRQVNLKGAFLKDWELYDEALSANVFINVPIAKHHGLTSLSLGLKNMMGIMGGNRGYLHRDMENALADVNGVVKSHLVVIDATRVLVDHGPQGGSLKDVKVLNKIIASTDIVAADAVATTLFGMKPEQLSTTVTAYKRGLGEMDLKKIKVLRA